MIVARMDNNAMVKGMDVVYFDNVYSIMPENGPTTLGHFMNGMEWQDDLIDMLIAENKNDGLCGTALEISVRQNAHIVQIYWC